MGQKIDKTSLMAEIQDKITTCKLYQEHSPDASAEARVAILDNNPCNDGKYYAVMTLKSPVTESSSRPEDLVSAKVSKTVKIISEEFSKIFICRLYYLV